MLPDQKIGVQKSLLYKAFLRPTAPEFCVPAEALFRRLRTKANSGATCCMQELFWELLKTTV